MTLGEVGRALVPPIVLIVAVLGSIIGGVATPTEAASVGAVGATLLASLRMPGMARWPAHLSAVAIVGLVVLATQFDMRLGRANAPMADRIAIMVATPLAIALAVGVLTAFYGIWRRGVLDGVDALILPPFAGGMLVVGNATGHPSICLRSGFTEDGGRVEPRSITLIGRPFDEAALIRAGAALEARLAVAARRPQMQWLS